MSAMRGEQTIHIDAPPERLWHMVSDVTRMGEWSPVTYRCRWIKDATGPEVGAMFKGHNRQGPARWSTACRVTEAEPGKVFEFVVTDTPFSLGMRGKPHTRWRYEFEHDGIGSKVTESYEVISLPPVMRPFSFVVRALDGQRRSGVHTTLERLKATAEEGIAGV